MALLNALAYSTSLTHLIYIFLSEGEENLQVLGGSSGAWGCSPEAGGHGQVWGRVLCLPHAVGLTVAKGGWLGVLQPNHSKWDLPVRQCCLLPNSHLHLLSSGQVRGQCQPLSHHSSPERRGSRAAPQLPPGLCSWRDTHMLLGPRHFFILAQNSSRDDYLKDESPNTIAKTHP